jgi:hypothetical protein
LKEKRPFKLMYKLPLNYPIDNRSLQLALGTAIDDGQKLEQLLDGTILVQQPWTLGMRIVAIFKASENGIQYTFTGNRERHDRLLSGILQYLDATRVDPPTYNPRPLR